MKQLAYWLLSLSLLTGIFIPANAQPKNLTLEDIFIKNIFRAEGVSGFRSMADGLHYSERNTQGDLVKVRFEDAYEVATIAPLGNLTYLGNKLDIQDYQFSQDEKHLLLFTQMEHVYRRSALYKVYYYDIAAKQLKKLLDESVMHASFSPDGKHIAYVFQNNLYHYDIAQELHTQITMDGSAQIINGNCDWVYEEEFEFTQAYTWSTDGSYLAYYKFDQSKVPDFSMTLYKGLYPEENHFRYPKAGEPNSKVSIRIYHLKNQKTVKADLGAETDIYIPRIRINPYNNVLMVYRMNRLQNHLELLETDPKSGNTQVIWEEKNKQYVEVHDQVKFLSKANAMVYLSEKNGYNHLYYFDLDQLKETVLTQGNWEVTELCGVDEDRQEVYYMSAEVSPMERNLYRVTLQGTDKKILTPEAGWHEVSFSDKFQYYLNVYSYLNHPPVYRLYNRDGKLMKTLKDNDKLKKLMKEYEPSPIQLMKIPNAQGEDLNAWMMKPTSLDPSKKYPLLMFQYSGPGSQQVMNRYGIRDYWWYQYLVRQGYVIACVDGTGTGGRGEAFKKKTYLQLGKYESDDQIAAARYLGSLPYIDKQRIGIWGWSYGGFMSSICIMKGSDVFKSAIAVAPVTNWRYYDNIYTERYMRTPAENAAGYDDNSPVNMVKQLKGNYLLIHGTADDNVHLQNSIMMVDALIKENKDFDSEFYPNKNHSIGGAGTRLHLYRRMTQFLLEKL